MKAYLTVLFMNYINWCNGYVWKVIDMKAVETNAPKPDNKLWSWIWNHWLWPWSMDEVECQCCRMIRGVMYGVVIGFIIGAIVC